MPPVLQTRVIGPSLLTLVLALGFSVGCDGAQPPAVGPDEPGDDAGAEEPAEPDARASADARASKDAPATAVDAPAMTMMDAPPPPDPTTSWSRPSRGRPSTSRAAWTTTARST